VVTDQFHTVERDRHPPVVPCDLPDGIQLVYSDDRGRRRAVTLDEAGAIDFGRTRAFREPPAYRGQHNFPGWWWSVTTRAHVVYESWLERLFWSHISPYGEVKVDMTRRISLHGDIARLPDE
jgi:hypothetical protein